MVTRPCGCAAEAELAALRAGIERLAWYYSKGNGETMTNADCFADDLRALLSPVDTTERPAHNHFTRDIRAPGKCPACDQRPHLNAAADRIEALAYRLTPEQAQEESEVGLREALFAAEAELAALPEKIAQAIEGLDHNPHLRSRSIGYKAAARIARSFAAALLSPVDTTEAPRPVVTTTEARDE